MAGSDERERTARYPASIVSWAHETLRLSFRDLGAVLHTDERTVRRWYAAAVMPRARYHERLKALAELRHVLEDVFERREDMVAWINTPLRTFRGRSPVTMLRQGRLTEVVGVLAAMDAGVYL